MREPNQMKILLLIVTALTECQRVDLHLKILSKKKLWILDDLVIYRVKDPLLVDLKLRIEMHPFQIKEKNNPKIGNKLLVKLELIDLSQIKDQLMKYQLNRGLIVDK